MLNPEQVQKLTKLIDNADVAAFFSELKAYGINDSLFNQLKKQFITGVSKNDADFHDRLKVALVDIPVSEVNSVQNAKNLDSVISQNFIQQYNLALIEGGVFWRGDYYKILGETLEYKIILTSFYIGKYLVTNSEYVQFLNNYGTNKVKLGPFSGEDLVEEHEWGIIRKNGQWQAQIGYENHPVVCVSWFGANEYCQYYGGDLPSEAQWEFAAKGGNKSKGFEYAGSNNLDSVAWHRGNSGDKNKEGNNRSHAVGNKLANELGLYDMSGNVWEWCKDWYDNDFYKMPESGYKNPVNNQNKNQDYRVLRGGSWSNFDCNLCRSAYRIRYLPYHRYSHIAFRFSKTL